MNELVNEGSEARGVIKQDVNLLADYNANVPPVGTPASQLKKALKNGGQVVMMLL